MIFDKKMKVNPNFKKQSDLTLKIEFLFIVLNFKDTDFNTIF